MADVSPSWVFVPDRAPVNAHRIKAEMAEPLRPSTAPTALSFLFGAATPNYFRASFVGTTIRALAAVRGVRTTYIFACF
ncbi:hypothetical protein EVAR_98622_1 [Eumeta japonica]|uniref:Uncharacterized protein n=1 Tax=Eumeta variegata TaxID=151549 RepID=A0A4C1XVH2_EUMVA|nr:hypothetical protein EVAR_98622_1 [Eumeta japonica]